MHLVPGHRRQQTPGARTDGRGSSGLSLAAVCASGPLHTHWRRAQRLVPALDRSSGAIGNMLTIRAMSDGKGYSSRHLEHSDYYAEGERVTGMWQGRGAELLGLDGAVPTNDFE